MPSNPTESLNDVVGVNDAVLHYLDIIYRLTQNGMPATTTEIAARVGVTPSGASVMLKRLAERSLVQLKPYRGAVLTPQGRQIALRTIRRHRLLEMFLHQVMGFAWHEVDEHAHALETVINEQFEDRMAEMLGNPIRCPHGHLIPAKDGTLPVVNDVPLLSQPVGTRGIVRCVDTDNPEWLKYFGEQGLMPGQRITLKEIAPYGGPVTLEATDGTTIILGRALAELIYIEVC
ncbi:MAG: metal-dependent transcriptional regulator [Anaerolineae bacterium]|nr:metal-dependent transcriptional regulator [Thermoflexales bacterium]MDW8396775.1 metal-dependent transcriptional regulator [Anaerolineae bacterium]